MSAATFNSDFSKRELTLFLCLGMLFAFVLSWAQLPKLSLLGCVSCMLVFARRRYLQAARGRDSVSLEVFGDQVYLLGYLFTIAAILGVFLQPGPSAADELIHAGALKLVTTVIGLIVMCSFKEAARLWNEEVAVGIKDENERLSSEVREAVHILVEDLARLRGKLSELSAAFDSDTPAKFSLFAKQLGHISEALPGMHLAVAQTTERLNSLNPQMLQLDAAIVSAREHGIEPLAKGLQAIVSSSTSARIEFDNVHKSAQQLCTALHALGEHASSGRQGIGSIAEAFSRLRQSFAKLDGYLQSLLRGQVSPEEAPLLMLQNVVQASIDTVGLLNQQLALANVRMDSLARSAPIDSSERLSEVVMGLADVALKIDATNAVLQQVIRAQTQSVIGSTPLPRTSIWNTIWNRLLRR
jgi:hypothetical protein